MTLIKITIDNSVRYVSKDSNSQSEQTQDSRPNTKKKDSIPKRKKTFHKIIKNSLNI